MKNMFIVFEGIDGCGKTTQLKLTSKFLKEKYPNYKIVVTKEPTDSIIGSLIKNIINNNINIDQLAMQLLFTADRAEHVAEIRKMLDKNAIVLCDRYMFSTFSYGASKMLDVEFLKQANRKFPIPDMTFIFDVDPKEAIGRILKRSNNVSENKMYEKLDILNAARQEFLKMKEQFSNYYIIKGDNSIDKINKEVISIIEKKLK